MVKLRVVGALAVVVFLAACASGPGTARLTPAATPLNNAGVGAVGNVLETEPSLFPAGGIPRERAIAIASAGDTSLHLDRAEVGPFSKFSPNSGSIDSDRTELVWAITFSGNFIHPCPSSGPCHAAAFSTGLLDYKTGEILLWILSDKRPG